MNQFYRDQKRIKHLVKLRTEPNKSFCFQVCSEGKCVGVKLELQGHPFQVDLRVVDLGI
jgi:hypothetical protein